MYRNDNDKQTNTHKYDTYSLLEGHGGYFIVSVEPKGTSLDIRCDHLLVYTSYAANKRINTYNFSNTFIHSYLTTIMTYTHLAIKLFFKAGTVLKASANSPNLLPSLNKTNGILNKNPIILVIAN